MAALAAAYAGDLAGAEELAARDHPATGSTWRAEQAYVAAEIASIAGRAAEAEAHYRRAIDLAAGVGATFVVGIATLGLLTVRVETGRFGEALHGYRDVIGYWERAGNWIQLWTTLRNLAVLLRALGDEEHGLFLEAAADHAAGAAEVGESAWQSPVRRRQPALPAATAAAIRARAARATRAEALDVARLAIDAHLR